MANTSCLIVNRRKFIMCGSNGINGGCCPPAQVFQEKICGNFNGPLAVLKYGLLQQALILQELLKFSTQLLVRLQ